MVSRITNYNPTWKMITCCEHYKEQSDKWKIAHFMAAGFRIGSDRCNVVPILPTRDVTLVYPVEGVMWATVRGGNVYFREISPLLSSPTKPKHRRSRASG